MTTLVDTSQTEIQLVVFDLASEAYGVDIGAVREIIRMQEITCVPRTPEFVEGVINLRGKVIPVIDLRRRFGLPVAEAPALHRQLPETTLKSHITLPYRRAVAHYRSR